MDYDKQILVVLAEAGENGLKLRKIARHVFNASNTLFSEVDFEDVYRYVQNYLRRNSKSHDPIIKTTGVRGTYKLDMKSKKARQMMLQFVEDDHNDKEEKTKDIDLSLSLF